jgi:hypothetical protein
MRKDEKAREKAHEAALVTWHDLVVGKPTSPRHAMEHAVTAALDAYLEGLIELSVEDENEAHAGNFVGSLTRQVATSAWLRALREG